jgi:hypothetical protein
MNETTTAAAKCACGNTATDHLANGTPACEWCADHDGHTAPASIATGHTLIGGEYVARCTLCAYVCAYWDCPCELAHECGETVRIVDGDYHNPAGYHVFGDGEFTDVTLCTDCYAHDNALGHDEPIGYWHETDTPIHCTTCDALLVTTLTRHGVEWVRDAIASSYGRNEIKRAWSIAFADELSDETK